jgi:hypothetical protein
MESLTSAKESYENVSHEEIEVKPSTPSLDLVEGKNDSVNSLAR